MRESDSDRFKEDIKKYEHQLSARKNLPLSQKALIYASLDDAYKRQMQSDPHANRVAIYGALAALNDRAADDLKESPKLRTHFLNLADKYTSLQNQVSHEQDRRKRLSSKIAAAIIGVSGVLFGSAIIKGNITGYAISNYNISGASIFGILSILLGICALILFIQLRKNQ